MLKRKCNEFAQRCGINLRPKAAQGTPKVGTTTKTARKNVSKKEKLIKIFEKGAIKIKQRNKEKNT